MSTLRPILDFWLLKVDGLGFLWRVLLGLCFILEVLRPATGLRPLRERVHSWGDEWFVKKDGNDLGSFSAWNITGTYRGKFSKLPLYYETNLPEHTAS